MRDFDDLFAALSKSKFRARFALAESDHAYVVEKTPEVIRAHARDFIRKRLASSGPLNDGKQTPMRGHPVFLAQHATATCCRKCLARWHRIKVGRALTDLEVDYVVSVIDRWITQQVCAERQLPGRQLHLFPRKLE